MIKPQYEPIAMHIFRFPNREMCLAEWNKRYLGTSLYSYGVTEINKFFDIVKP